MQRNCILSCNRLLATIELSKIYLKGFSTAIISGFFFLWHGKIVFQNWFLMSTICIYHLPFKTNWSMEVNTSLAITFKRRRIMSSMIQFLFSVACYKSKVTWSKFPVIKICIWCYVLKHLSCWRLSSRSLAELWFCCLWGFWLFLYLLWLNNSETSKCFLEGVKRANIYKK